MGNTFEKPSPVTKIKMRVVSKSFEKIIPIKPASASKVLTTINTLMLIFRRSIAPINLPVMSEAK